MDPFSFLSWSFILFALGICAIMQIIRTTVEFLFPVIKQKAFWNSFLLLNLPLLIGGGMGDLLKLYPYAPDLAGQANHIVYGLAAGLLSTLIFKMVKELLGNKLQAMAGVLFNNSNNTIITTNDSASNTIINNNNVGMSSNNLPTPPNDKKD